MKFYIISYNNGWLVQNAVDALSKFNELEIIIVDNASTGLRTMAVLDRFDTMGVCVIRLKENFGHNVVFEIIKPTDEYYIVTDPDLELSNLPGDSIEKLLYVSKNTGALKVGLALKQEPHDFLEGIYFRGNTIATHEAVFWTQRVEKLLPLEAYYADIDTTFALYRPGNTGPQIRVAGEYCVRHLPWHKSWIDVTPREDLFEYLSKSNLGGVSTTTRLILQYLHSLSFSVGD